ncbi:acyl carrier protein [Streptomyces sp. NBC_00237]|uniref:acyl carrier protein n=1 Tax=Streptomyces sp. NBC_00237 TaxID=2975687 RepID=UPI0022513B1A|nr:acyl carrier protein [Streptomyces sp. NBC_00237]MCX5205219.1 acyl carrier protein [Streptomyces sp. NBC_00237]
MSTSAQLDTQDTRGTLEIVTGLLVEKFEADPAAVRELTPMTDLLIDSLMVVEMAITLQDELGVKLGEEDLRDLTLGEFVSRVDERRARA